MTVLLQIDFSMPAEMLGDTLSKNAANLAETINLEPGFISKIWTENVKTQEAGGIYLFTDTASAERYAIMHKKRVEAMGAKNINCKLFDINASLTAINHGL